MLQHVTLEIGTGDVEHCVAFWRVLGFERMAPPPLLRDRFVWVGRGGTQIHLQPRERPVTTDQGHAAVVVDDYEGTLAALRDGGFELREGSNAWDAPRSFVRDPAGNLVEVMSKPPQPPWPDEDAAGG
jgi:catechol 2,3-dioxygenase-like lactoylglutathione lyase family enzyme